MLFAQNKKLMTFFQKGDFSPYNLCRNFTLQSHSDSDSWKYNFIGRKNKSESRSPSSSLHPCWPLRSTVHDMKADRTSLMLMYGEWSIHSQSQRKAGWKFSIFLSLALATLFHADCYTEAFSQIAAEHNPSIHGKLLTSSTPLLLLHLMRLNIYFFGDCMSHNNSVVVTFTASLPSSTCKI